jgi:hypothetical protein
VFVMVVTMPVGVIAVVVVRLRMGVISPLM